MTAAVLYGNFRAELLVEHGTRLDRVSLETAAPALRRRDFDQPAPAPGTELLGRSGLLNQLAEVARPGWAIELRAPCGFGKSSLLSALAARLAAARPAPVVTVRVGPLSADDALDRLFGALYTADKPVKPTAEQRSSLLAQVRAIVVLDDVGLAPDQVAGVLATLPQCLVLVGAERPVVEAAGASVAIEGLAEPAGLQLLARDLGRPLDDAEHDDAVRLCAAVQGQPLRLRQAAALAAAGEGSLHSLAARAERDPLALDRLTVHALGDAERRVLAVLALAAGAVLPGDLVEVISGIGEIAEQLGQLRRRGLVEQERDRFGLPRCMGEGYRKLLLANLQLGGSVQPLVGWLGQRDPTGSDALAGAGAAVELLGVLAERAEWAELARLAEVTSRVLTLAGRWETCRQVLQQGLHAARQLGDLAAEARFSHDLGSLQLCADELQQAHDLLTRALVLRQEHGDREGAALTRHNLALLPAAPPPPPDPRRAPRQGLRDRLRQARRRLPALLSLAGLFALLMLFLWRTLAPGLPTTTNTTTTTIRPVSSATSTRPTAPTRTTGTTGPSSGPAGSGGGPGLPGIAAPGSVRFPLTAVGSTAVQVFQVTSTGKGPLRLGDFELDGDRADFTVDGCRRVSLAQGRSCQITARFTPTAEGGRRATLTVHQNLPGPPTRVLLAGTGGPGPTPTFTVSVATEGTDLRVTSAPPGIDCPGTCQSTFPAGSTVTLQGATGSGTVVWEGDCAGAVDVCTLTVDRDRQVLVSVKPVTASLAVTVSGTSGKVTSDPPGIDCTNDDGTCLAKFPAGADVTLTASSTLVIWGGACKGSGPTCSVTLGEDTKVEAQFYVVP